MYVGCFFLDAVAKHPIKATYGRSGLRLLTGRADPIAAAEVCQRVLSYPHCIIVSGSQKECISMLSSVSFNHLVPQNLHRAVLPSSVKSLWLSLHTIMIKKDGPCQKKPLVLVVPASSPHRTSIVDGSHGFWYCVVEQNREQEKG